MANIIELKDTLMNKFYVNADNIIIFSHVNSDTQKNAKAKLIFIDGSDVSVVDSIEDIANKIHSASQTNFDSGE
ncbi:hypothetical protein BCS42_01885 [Crenothrix sp. D3]|nr:hypothetical protein BCS42_01885 [Crenothrix sp. D3]